MIDISFEKDGKLLTNWFDIEITKLSPEFLRSAVKECDSWEVKIRAKKDISRGYSVQLGLDFTSKTKPTELSLEAWYKLSSLRVDTKDDAVKLFVFEELSTIFKEKLQVFLDFSKEYKLWED